jgi:hypothetical protein
LLQIVVANDQFSCSECREPVTEKKPLQVTEVREDQKIREPPTIRPDYVGRHHDDIEHEAIRYFIRRGDFR